jgi:hypothetical protein
LEFSSKIAQIEGEIPPTESKNMKMGDFGKHNRKTSPYLARYKLHSEFNWKISAYFTFAGFL